MSAAIGKAAASAGGAGLAALIGLISRLRAARKPLHPRGLQLPGILTREGCEERWGVPWLDERGTAGVTARLSRGLGLPSSVPDVLGLAVRISEGDQVTDLLFSTTGTGRLTRFLLVPRRVPDGGYGTLMPYRTPTGPVLLAAVVRRRERNADIIDTGATVVLSTARPRGPWHRFGVIDLRPRGERPDDPPISFDPVYNAPPDLPPYEWTRRLRERAYAAARRHRTDDAGSAA
jgi:hypothetical protein